MLVLLTRSNSLFVLTVIIMKIDKIYFDLDGVLADFDRGVEELCGLEPVDQTNSKPQDHDRLFNAIKEIDHFYDKLEFVAGAKEMFKRVNEKYPGSCEILTGIPKPRRGIITAGDDKRNWVHRNLGDDIKVHIVYREEKKNYVGGPEYILVDDYEKNITEWESCGGTGIHFKSAEETLKILARIEKALK